ncbi:hypothetical protein CBS147332_3174 [Penicillium roqueforti]|nr:hypothetical protein CBS147332_3174 [Penicillium roqueforti]KAI3125598.1 hypothetical protein CBS147331_592 [Penicillium roqueforti]
MGRFMNTTPTVTDIVAIIERPGEWRENMANAIIASKLTLPEVQRQAIHKATRWKQGAELLQYWGFSYGTVLGATFAAMYPHRVKQPEQMDGRHLGLFSNTLLGIENSTEMEIRGTY